MKLNKRQRQVLRDILTVIAITCFAIFLLFNFKDMVIKTEAMRAMRQLGNFVTQYKKENGIIPPKSVIEDIEEQLQGSERLGDFRYRGIWMDYKSEPDEIIAYVKKDFNNLLVRSGVIILRLNGEVEFISNKKFSEIISEQMTKQEKDYLKKGES